MGFGSFFKKIGSGIKSGFQKAGKWIGGAARKVGQFVKEGGIQRVLGKVSGIARKAGDFLSRPEVQGILTSLGTVPYIGAVARGLQVAAPVLSTGGRVGEGAAQLGTGIQSAIENKDASMIPELLKQGQGVLGDAQQFRGQFKK